MNYTHQTTYGQIAISWQREDGKFVMECEVPVGTTATIYVPCAGEQPRVKENEHIRFVEIYDGYAIYEVQSGSYKFKSKI